MLEEIDSQEVYVENNVIGDRPERDGTSNEPDECNGTNGVSVVHPETMISGTNPRSDSGKSPGRFSYARRGFLAKKGMGRFFKPWALRFFILEVNQVLSYYEGNDCRGSLTLDGASVRKVPAEEADGKEYAFEVFNLNIARAEKFKSSRLLMAASSKQECRMWVKCLEAAVQSDIRSRTAQGQVYESFRSLSRPEVA